MEPTTFANCTANFSAADVQRLQATPCLLKLLPPGDGSGCDLQNRFLQIAEPATAFVGLLVNLLFIGVAGYGVRWQAWGKRRSAFTVSQSAASALLCAFVVGVQALNLAVETIAFASVCVFLLLCSQQTLVTVGDYTALQLLQVMAVRSRRRYKYAFGQRRCFRMIMLIWIVSIFDAVLAGPLGTVLFVPESGIVFSGSSQLPLIYLMLVVILGGLITVVGTYIYALMALRDKRPDDSADSPKKSSEDRDRRHRRRWRLRMHGVNVGLFALLTVTLFVTAVYTTMSLHTYTQLSLQAPPTDQCRFLIHLLLVKRVDSMAGAVVMAFLLRTVFDPLWALFSQRKLRALLRRRWRRQRTTVDSSATITKHRRRRRRTSTASSGTSVVMDDIVHQLASLPSTIELPPMKSCSDVMQMETPVIRRALPL